MFRELEPNVNQWFTAIQGCQPAITQKWVYTLLTFITIQNPTPFSSQLFWVKLPFFAYLNKTHLTSPDFWSFQKTRLLITFAIEKKKDKPVNFNRNKNLHTLMIAAIFQQIKLVNSLKIKPSKSTCLHNPVSLIHTNFSCA